MRVSLGIGDHQRRILTQPGKIKESLKFEKLPRKSSLKGMTGRVGVGHGCRVRRCAL